MPVNPSGKFQLRRDPRPPYKCSSCGAGSTGKEDFIDWGLTIDWEGTIYLCMDCGAELAVTIDYISPVAASVLHEAIETLKGELKDAHDSIANLNNELASYRTVFSPDVLREATNEVERLRNLASSEAESGSSK